MFGDEFVAELKELYGTVGLRLSSCHSPDNSVKAEKGLN